MRRALIVVALQLSMSNLSFARDPLPPTLASLVGDGYEIKTNATIGERNMLIIQKQNSAYVCMLAVKIDDIAFAGYDLGMTRCFPFSDK